MKLLRVASLAFAIWPSVALAGDKALAEQLFRRAQEIMRSSPSREQIDQACHLYKDSYDNDPAINTEVALASCYEKLGKNVTAWALYSEASAGTGPAADYAKERAKALASKGFLKLKFEARGLPPDAKVMLDGGSLSSAALSIPIDADPGPHVVVIQIPGQKTIEKKIDLSPEQSPLLVVLTPDAAPPPSTPPPSTPPPSTPPPGAPPPTSSSPTTTAQNPSAEVLPPPTEQGPPSSEKATSSPMRTIGLVTAGVGLATIAVGAIFGIAAASQQGAAGCPQNVCKDPRDADTLRGAIGLANVSTALFIAGGVVAAGGATMWILSPKTRATAAVGPSGAMFSVQGVF